MPSTNRYLDILKSGLPDSSKKHFCIVGAGITGLIAASLFKSAGHKVTILEAQNRIGGRIYTYRNLPDDMYAEFGAMRWPKTHPLMQHLIHERFKLKTKPFILHNPNCYIRLLGKNFRSDEFSLDKLSLLLNQNERNKAPKEIIDQAIEPLVSTLKEESWASLVNKFDKYSILTYFKEQGFSDELISIIGVLFNFEPRMHFSLVEWFVQYYDEIFNDLEYIIDGADALVKPFEQELHDNIRLGTKVTAINQDVDSVEIQYQTMAGIYNLKADACLITVPFMLLSNIPIQGIDSAKEYQLRTTYYGRAHKIFMQFSERWWVDKYGIESGLTVSDSSIRNLVYTPAGQAKTSKRGLIITSYCWEQDSMPYSPLGNNDRLRMALEELRKIHPEAKDTFEYGVSYDWALDQYACGIGPIFRPHEMSGLRFLDTVRPIGNVWFANDATDRRHRRWAEASARSAVRNAYCMVTGTPIESWLSSSED